MKRFVLILLISFSFLCCSNNTSDNSHKPSISINDNNDNICISCVCSETFPVSLTGVELKNNDNEYKTFTFDNVDKTRSNDLYIESGEILINKPEELRQFLNKGFIARVLTEKINYNFSDCAICY